MDDVSEAIGALRAEVRQMREEITDLKKSVDTFQSYRYIGLGILAAVACLGGVVGVKVAALWHFFAGA